MIALAFGLLLDYTRVSCKKHDTTSAIQADKKPGVMVRVDKASIDQIKYGMRDFLPHYFN